MLKKIFSGLFGQPISKEAGDGPAQNAKYYKTLGVKPGASLEAVKKAYEEQKQRWAPELFSYDERLKQRMEELVKELDEAYQKAMAELTDKGK